MDPTIVPIDVTIPQEIIDTIISQFAYTSDTQSLRTCALVSSSWLPTARSHLFHHITLSPPPFFAGRSGSRTRNWPCERLLAVLQSSSSPSSSSTSYSTRRPPNTTVAAGNRIQSSTSGSLKESKLQCQSQMRHTEAVSNGTFSGTTTSATTTTDLTLRRSVSANSSSASETETGSTIHPRPRTPLLRRHHYRYGRTICVEKEEGQRAQQPTDPRGVARPSSPSLSTTTTTATTPDSDHQHPSSEDAAAVKTVNSVNLGIAVYIKALTLLEGIGPRSWFSHEPTLGPLLRLLVHLERFEIRCLASGAIFWNHLAAKPRDALREGVLTRPSLERMSLGNLWLDGVKDWVELVKDCGGLRELEVENVRFKDESLGGGSDKSADGNDGYGSNSNGTLALRLRETVRKAPLDVLRLGPGTSPAIIQTFLQASCRFEIRTIRKLSLTIAGDFAEYARLLGSMTSVESMNITLADDVDLDDYWSLAPHDQLDLAQLPCLQDLQIGIDAATRKKLSVDQGLTWIEHLLKTNRAPLSGSYGVTRPNQLRRLLVVCTIHSLAAPTSPLSDTSDTMSDTFSGWERVDEVLCGESEDGGNPYAHLERVMLHLVQKTSTPATSTTASNTTATVSSTPLGSERLPPMSDVFRQVIARHSPRLSKCGILEVQGLVESSVSEK